MPAAAKANPTNSKPWPAPEPAVAARVHHNNNNARPKQDVKAPWKPAGVAKHGIVPDFSSIISPSKLFAPFQYPNDYRSFNCLVELQSYLHASRFHELSEAMERGLKAVGQDAKPLSFLQFP